MYDVGGRIHDGIVVALGKECLGTDLGGEIQFLLKPLPEQSGLMYLAGATFDFEQNHHLVAHVPVRSTWDFP